MTHLDAILRLPDSHLAERTSDALQNFALYSIPFTRGRHGLHREVEPVWYDAIADRHVKVFDQPEDDTSEKARSRAGIGRREFLGSAGLTAVATAAGGARAELDPHVSAAETLPVTLIVNGQPRHLSVEARTTLLDVLRGPLELIGPKKACDRGECGACTVHVSGRRMLSCMTLAVMHDGHEITTIEGLANDKALHPVQSLMIDHDGMQCGFCTSGQIMSGVAMLAEAKAGWPSAATSDLGRRSGLADLTRAEVQERMSGNLCRCACYPNIVDAMMAAAGRA